MLCAMSGTRFAALLTPILGDVSHSAPANDIRSEESMDNEGQGK
jgi:hypothetical protein